MLRYYSTLLKCSVHIVIRVLVGVLCGSFRIFGFQGFQTLVEKEWLCFGHKFADRTGQVGEDDHEQSPVFLQWLDCVHQLAVQFPTAFEFSCIYLVCSEEGIHPLRSIFAGFFFFFLSGEVGTPLLLTLIWYVPW